MPMYSGSSHRSKQSAAPLICTPANPAARVIPVHTMTSWSFWSRMTSPRPMVSVPAAANGTTGSPPPVYTPPTTDPFLYATTVPAVNPDAVSRRTPHMNPAFGDSRSAIWYAPAPAVSGTWTAPIGTWCSRSKARARACPSASRPPASCRPIARTAPAATPNPPPSLTLGPLRDAPGDRAPGHHVDRHHDDESAEQRGDQRDGLLPAADAVLARARLGPGDSSGRGGAVGAGAGLLSSLLGHARHRTPGAGQGVRAQRQFSFDPPPAPVTPGPTFRRSADSVRSVTQPRCPWPGAARLLA